MTYGTTPLSPGLLGSSPSARSAVVPINRSFKQTSPAGSAASAPDYGPKPSSYEFSRRFSFGVSCRSSITDSLPPTGCAIPRRSFSQVSPAAQVQTVTYGFDTEVRSSYSVTDSLPRTAPSAVRRSVSQAAQVQTVTYGFDAGFSSTDPLPRASSISSRRSSPRAVQATQVQKVTYGFNADTSVCDRDDCESLSRSRPEAGLLSRAFSSNTLCGADAVPSISMMQEQVEMAIAHHAAKSLEERWRAPAAHKLESQGMPAAFSADVVRMAYHIASLAHSQQQHHQGVISSTSNCGLEQSVDTAKILADLGLSSEMVAAGLLHNVLDTTNMSKYQLQEYLPSEVVDVVENAQKISTINKLYRQHTDSVDADSVVDFFTAMSSVQAVIVKLADKLQTMRNIGSVTTRAEQIVLAKEALHIYSPLANRLGLWCIKAELEDLSFQTLEPQAYEELKNQVIQRQKQGFLEYAVNLLKVKLESRGIKVADISGRPKNLWGIYQKLQKGDTFDQVYDVYAIRVITNSKEDCYIVRDLVCSMWQHLPNRSKDFIRNKKDNGYQSLHETVLDEQGLPFEVQIRTHKMHFMAEYGMSAHWQYKESSQCKAEKCEHMHSLIKWNRWLTAWKMGVYDKKIRPEGSPPMDLSLVSLGVQYCDSSEEKLDPLLRHERFRLKPVTQERDPDVNIVVLIPDQAMRLQQLPAGTTVAGLLSLLENEVVSPFDPILKVNGLDVFPMSHDQVLQNGDQVVLSYGGSMLSSQRATDALLQCCPPLSTGYAAARSAILYAA